ncbi:MAG: CmcI family methyltransferase [Terriglobia bacterium]
MLKSRNQGIKVFVWRALSTIIEYARSISRTLEVKMSNRPSRPFDDLLTVSVMIVLAASAIGVAARLRIGFVSPDPELPRWLGTPVWKTPGLLMALQEVVHQVKPDIILETGTYKGGGTLFFASLLDLEARGDVISIDITDWTPKPLHPRITYLTGSSTSPVVAAQIRGMVSHDAVVLVDLDASHYKADVLSELRLYADLVSVGSYFIVEDATTGRRTWWWEGEFGPGEAAREFISENRNYVQDTSWEERLGNSYGNRYLRRIK